MEAYELLDEFGQLMGGGLLTGSEVGLIVGRKVGRIIGYDVGRMVGYIGG